MSEAGARERESGTREPDDSEERGLSGAEKRTIALLGLPTMALALAVTVVTTYLPTVAHAFISSNVVMGMVIGLEGLMAVWLPLVVGTRSDQLDTASAGGCRSCSWPAPSSSSG